MGELCIQESCFMMKRKIKNFGGIEKLEKRI